MSEHKTSFIDAEDLRPILKFVGKNWFLILLFPLIGALIALLLTHRMPNIYAAKTEILLKSSETYDYQSQIYNNLGYYSLLADVTNQKRVISSYDLIAKSLAKLDFSTSYYIVGRVRTVQKVSLKLISVDCELNHEALYEQPIDIKILDTKTYSISYNIGTKQVTRNCQFGVPVDDENFKNLVITNNDVTESNLSSVREANYQFKKHKRENLIKKYKANLEVSNVEYTSILTLSCNDELPERAKQFLDTLAKVYIDYTLEAQINVNENTQKYIDKQLAEITLIIDSLERQIEMFKDTRKILDLSKEQEAAFQNLTNAEVEKGRLDLRMQAIEALEEFLKDEKDQAALPPMNYLEEDDLTLRQQVNELYRKNLERSQRLIDLNENATEIVKIDSLIRDIRYGIFKYTRDTKVAIASRIGDLNEQISVLEQKLAGIPKFERDLLGIDRRLAVNESLYTFLLEKKANTVIARAAIIPQTSVIESARSMGVVGPNKQKTI
ncbi:MAG: hypothetical protein JNM00_00065, partial [Flavobacteriales bacterium]|nr:hypothetical protein [Flavobacteriales bacterium]